MLFQIGSGHPCWKCKSFRGTVFTCAHTNCFVRAEMSTGVIFYSVCILYLLSYPFQPSPLHFQSDATTLPPCIVINSYTAAETQGFCTDNLPCPPCLTWTKHWLPINAFSIFHELTLNRVVHAEKDLRSVGPRADVWQAAIWCVWMVGKVLNFGHNRNTHL